MGSIKDKLKEKFLGEKDLSDNSKTSKPKKKRAKARKSNICDTCNQNILENEMRNMYMFQDTYHQLRTKEYCKSHEEKYTDHKCRPCWCGDCNYLIKYEIEIQKG